MLKHAIWSALVVSSAAAMAQGPAPTTATAKAGASEDPNEMVCRREQEIGSRLNSRRVCRTRAEWAAIREQTRQVVNRIQEQRGTSGQ